LRFGVRIDQPGQLLRDFHTARSNPDKPPYVTERHYLADAVFLVGLEGDESLLFTLDKAIQAPVFPLFLGRRSCPPVGRILLGIRNKPLEEALREEPWHASQWFKEKVKNELNLTFVVDANPDQSGAFSRRDYPISFSQKHRKYGFRYVDDRVATVVTDDIVDAGGRNSTDHDPFIELED
jgi:CRISPR system Cascade subunit CasD